MKASVSAKRKAKHVDNSESKFEANSDENYDDDSDSDSSNAEMKEMVAMIMKGFKKMKYMKFRKASNFSKKVSSDESNDMYRRMMKKRASLKSLTRQMSNAITVMA